MTVPRMRTKLVRARNVVVAGLIDPSSASKTRDSFRSRVRGRWRRAHVDAHAILRSIAAAPPVLVGFATAQEIELARPLAHRLGEGMLQHQRPRAAGGKARVEPADIGMGPVSHMKTVVDCAELVSNVEPVEAQPPAPQKPLRPAPQKPLRRLMVKGLRRRAAEDTGLIALMPSARCAARTSAFNESASVRRSALSMRNPPRFAARRWPWRSFDMCPDGSMPARSARACCRSSTTQGVSSSVRAASRSGSSESSVEPAGRLRKSPVSQASARAAT